MINELIRRYRKQSSYFKIRIWIAVSFYLFFITLMNIMSISILLAFHEGSYVLRATIPLIVFFFATLWALGNALRIIRIIGEDFDRRHKRGEYETIYLPDIDNS